ncbi:oxygenase MpaB family protein [Arthrobacter sp. HMWF013]|uniref:oxygenase MpaB family protein n=1 Tax=Arthrobacter sp. HMWF013 TaxID=2056849 RepID=UPI002159D08C|nr:oxygenase MpaB family protein [Arthrobacter sp. HMWF013]
MVPAHADMSAEAILLAGAGRAILLQLAHPAIGHGVAEHSSFTQRPVDRLRGTLTYVYAVTYGNDEQVKEVRRRVNRAHAPVRRAPDGSSDGYSAFEAQAQLWVVATLYDTAVIILDRIYGPFDDAAADGMYRDYAKIGTALQLPAELWPEDRAAFRRYYEPRLAALRAHDAAVRVGRGLLYPPGSAPLWYRAVMPFARFLTAGFLPHPLRQDFGLRWSRRHEHGFNLTFRGLAVVYPRMPRRIRHWFKDYCLGQLTSDLASDVGDSGAAAAVTGGGGSDVRHR